MARTSGIQQPPRILAGPTADGNAIADATGMLA